MSRCQIPVHLTSITNTLFLPDLHKNEHCCALLAVEFHGRTATFCHLSVMCLSVIASLGLHQGGGFKPFNLGCVVTSDDIFVKMHAKEEMATYSLKFLSQHNSSVKYTFNFVEII